MIKILSKTCDYFSFRLSTVINADKGKVLEEGSHEILYKNKGHHYNLWKQQMLSFLAENIDSKPIETL